MAGRLIILKSVLESIPIYWLNLFKIPSAVIAKIDKIRKDFLWNGSNPNHRKLHLIKWDKVCKDKKIGGLGIASIKWKNLSLLAK